MSDLTLAGAPDDEMRTRVPPPPSGRSVYLQPGQVAVTRVPTTIVTILGSCVGVSLHDPVMGIGGLNHFLLPQWTDANQESNRFGGPAMRTLLTKVIDNGAHPARLQAKVFGGACTLASFAGRGRQLGEENVALALHFLQTAGIRVVSEDVGGERGRKVIFDTMTGDVWVRKL